MNRPLKWVIAILAITAVLAFLSDCLIPYAASIETRGELRYTYRVGEEPLVLVKFKIPSEIAREIIVTEVTEGWTYELEDGDLILKGGVLKPGQHIAVEYRLKRYIEPKNLTVTGIGITASERTVVSEGEMVVREAAVLKLLSSLSYYKAVIVASLIILVGGALLAGGKATVSLPCSKIGEKLKKVKESYERSKAELRKIEREIQETEYYVKELKKKVEILSEEYDKAVKEEKKAEEEFKDAQKIVENVLKNISGERRKRYEKIYKRVLEGEISPDEPRGFGTLQKLNNTRRMLKEAKDIRGKVEKELNGLRNKIEKAEEKKRGLEKTLRDIKRKIKLFEEELKRWEDEYVDCLWWDRDCKKLKSIRIKR